MVLLHVFLTVAFGDDFAAHAARAETKVAAVVGNPNLQAVKLSFTDGAVKFDGWARVRREGCGWPTAFRGGVPSRHRLRCFPLFR